MEQTMYMGGWFGRPYIFLRNCPEKRPAGPSDSVPYGMKGAVFHGKSIPH